MVKEVRTEVEPLMKQLATDFAGKKLLDLSDLAVGDGNSIPQFHIATPWAWF